MVDMILILLLAVILGSAIRYIIKEKKNGAKCIGCAMACSCGQKKNSGCGTGK